MYMRIVRAAPNEGQADELARRWEGFVLPQMRQQSGFRHAYFSIDRSANRTAVVSLWDTLPDEAGLAAMVEAFRAQVADIVSGPPEIVDYEVVIEA